MNWVRILLIALGLLLAAGGTAYYAVDGRALRGGRIWLTEQTDVGTREAAGRFIAGYAPGARVAVHYYPADPSDAALIVESRLWPIFILIGVGLLMIGLGGFLPMRR